MFLLIPQAEWFDAAKRQYFTFHDVSINTTLYVLEFHLHISLHSTMFLLIRLLLIHQENRQLPLHSTMFLLIQIEKHTGTAPSVFTFHDVSINTNKEMTEHLLMSSLHSTMFLLILICMIIESLCLIFTFHDVSINTVLPAHRPQIRQPLHSTMFLLIRYQKLLIFNQ